MATFRRRKASVFSWNEAVPAARRQTKRAWKFERLDDRCLLAAMPIHAGGEDEMEAAGQVIAISAAAAPAAPAAAPPANSISGSVFRDLNGDGARESWESGLPGMSLFIDVNGNGVRDQFSRSYSYNGPTLHLDVPSTPISPTINVQFAPTLVRDVDVSVSIEHDWDSDLVIDVLHPQGDGIRLADRNGGSGNDFWTTTFDDEASTFIASGSAPFNGRYRPYGSLSNFDDRNPNGAWTLRVWDLDDSAFFSDEGTFSSWSLTFTFDEPTVTTDADGNYTFTNLASGTHRVRAIMPSAWLATIGYQDVTLASGGYAENATFAMRPTDVPLLTPDNQEPSNETPQGAFSWIPFCPLEGCQGSRIIQRRSIHEPQDVDWYRFETILQSDAEDHVRVYNFDPRLGDLALDLYDQSALTNANAVPIASARSTGGVDRVEISLKGLSPGVYFARVSGAAGATSPSYSLAVVHPGVDWLDNLREAPSNDSRLTATDLGRPVGAATRDFLSIGPAADEDWFRFETLAQATEAHFVKIDFDHEVGDLDLELYAETDGPDGPWTLISNGVVDGERIDLDGLPAGAYYARVHGFDRATNPYYRFEIHVPYGATGDPYEGASGNNSQAIAYDLGRFEGEEIVNRASLHSLADRDWFRFETVAIGGAGDFARADFDARLGDVDIILRDSAGAEVTRSQATGDRDEVSLAGRPAGVYYLEAYAYGELANPDYTVTFNAPRALAPDWAEPNDQFDRGRDLGTVSGRNTWDSLSLHWTGDYDEFFFTLPQRGVAGNFVRIDFEHSLGDVDVTLDQLGGGRVGFGRSQRNYELISLEGLPPGQYRLTPFVGSVGGTSPYYRITIDAPPALVADRYERIEGVDSPWELGVLQGERKLEHLSLHDATDLDWFRFEIIEPAVAGHYARADLDHEMGDVDLWLFEFVDNDGAGEWRLLRKSNSQTDREEILMAGLVPGRQYAVLVDGKFVDGKSPEYSLTINAPRPFNTDWAEGADGNNDLFDPYDLGRVRGRQMWSNLSIPTYDDLDFFRFELPEAGSSSHFVQLDFIHALGDVDMYLYDAQGDLVEWSTGVTDQEQISLDGLAAGSPYYLRVQTWDSDVNPNYTLTMNAPAGRDGDPFEYNDEVRFATDLGPLQGINHWDGDAFPLSVHTAGDVDYYRFQLTETAAIGHFARIEFDHAVGDLNVELYRDGDLQAWRSSTATSNVEEIGLASLTPGTYYLRVYGTNGAINPRYRLSVNAPGYDWSETGLDTATTAFELGQVAGFWSRDGLSIHADDADWFKFTLPANQVEGNYARIDFLQAQGNLDIDLFTDPNGEPIHAPQTGGDGKRISLAGLPALDNVGNPIEYYARVRGADAGAARAQNAAYSLSLYTNRVLQSDLFEPTTVNTPVRLHEISGPLRIGDEFLNDAYLSLSIDAPGDEDWFEFTTMADAVPAHFVSLAFNHFAGDLDLELWDKSGLVLLRHARTSGNVETVSLHGLDAGTYRVKVSGHDGATNPEYVLSINAPGHIYTDWSEVNNNEAAAKDLRTIEGVRRFDELSINEADDVDWFRFQVAGAPIAGNLIAIDYDPAYGHLDLELYDATGQNLLAQAGDFTGHSEIVMAGRVEQDSAYLVKVAARSYQGIQPRYALTFVAPQSQGDRTEGTTDDEPHDLGAVQGFQTIDDLSIHATSDEDWFTFSLSTAPVIGHWLALSSEFQSGDLDVELYDSPTVELPIREAIGGAGSANLERIDLAELAVDTTYYLRVFGYRGATNPEYQLLVNAPIAYAQEGDAWEATGGPSGNNSRVTATRLQTVEGLTAATGLSIHSALDEDWFAFQLPRTATRGHYVAIDFDHSQGNLEIDLRDQNGNPVFGSSTGRSDHEQLSLAGLAATPGGNPSNFYYLRVYGAANPSYTLTFNAPVIAQADRFDRHGRRNDSQNAAAALREVPGTLIVGELSLHTAADVDWFRFETIADAVAGHNVRIEFNGQEGTPTLELYDAGGRPIETALDAYADYQEISLGGLASGTYFVKIAGASNPAYQLVIRAPSLPMPDVAEGKIGNNEPAAAYDLRSVAAAGGRVYENVLPGFNASSGYPICARTFVNSCVQPRFDPSSPTPNYGISDPRIAGFGSGYGGTFTEAEQNNALNGVVPWMFQTDAFDHEQLIADISEAARSGITLDQLNQQRAAATFQQTQQQINASNAAIAEITARDRLFKTFMVLAIKRLFGRAEDASGLPMNTLGGLSIDLPNDVDWYQFNLADDGLPGQNVRILFDHDLGDLQLELYSKLANGSAASEPIDVSSAQADFEEISLARLRRGDYFLRVTGVGGATNPNYRLQFSIASPADNLQPDWAESNETRDDAHELRRLEGPRIFDELSIHVPEDEDWFRFDLPQAAGDDSFVALSFLHSQGDLDLELYRRTFDPLACALLGLCNYHYDLMATADGTTNLERVALKDAHGNPVPAGGYFLRVSGYDGATNPHYSLVFNLPESTLGADHLEGNNTPPEATNLNNLSGASRVDGLTITPGDSDWFRFRTTGPGGAVTINFDGAAGDLQLELYSDGITSTPVLWSRGDGSSETITIPNSWTADEYYVRVYGQTGESGRYDLRIDAPITPQGTAADWTIMVYMTAGELAEYAFEDINEMEEAAGQLPGSVKIVVLYDQPSHPSLIASQKSTGNGLQDAWGDTRLGVIRPDTNRDEIATDFSVLGGEQNTALSDTLQSFITDAAVLAPANNYALILWNHGGGIRGTNYDRFDPNQPYPEDTVLSIREIADALAATPTEIRPKLIGFDACFMGMAEIASMLAPYTADGAVIVASQEVESFGGFDYTTALDALVGQPGPVPVEALAAGMVASFQRKYQDDPQGANTLSATLTHRYGAVEEALSWFSLHSTWALSSGLESEALHAILREARNATPSSSGQSDFRDLGRFMKEVADRTAGLEEFPLVHNAARDVVTALQNAVLAKTADLAGATGLSIYLPAPGESIDSIYESIGDFGPFFSNTLWDSFVEQFVACDICTPAAKSDWSEPNDIALRAYNLHDLAGGGHVLSGLTLHATDDVDWFRFRTLAAGTLATKVNFPTGQGALRLSVFDAGDTAIPLATTQSENGQLVVNLVDAPTGEYLLHMEADDVATTPLLYSLVIDAPLPDVDVADWANGNHTANKARALGTIRKSTVWTGLRASQSRPDWFVFDTPRTVSDEPCIVGAVTVHLATEGAAVLRLYDATQDARVEEPLAEQSGRGVIRAFYSTAAGKSYRLSIEAMDEAAQSYSVEFDPTIAGACATLAYSNFDEPSRDSANYFPASGSRELGFVTERQDAGAFPYVGVVPTSTTPTTPIFTHQSVRAITTVDTVDLTNVDAASVTIAMQVRDTGYEFGDYVRMYLTYGDEEVYLLQAYGSDTVDPLDELAGEGFLTYSAAIPDRWTEATLILESATNSTVGAERFDFDSVAFHGTGLPRMAGDLNDDGRVGLLDLAMLQRNYGLAVESAESAAADLNSDGRVNREDIAVFVSNFGRVSPPPSSVSPSPAASAASAVTQRVSVGHTRRTATSREEPAAVGRLIAERNTRRTVRAVDEAMAEFARPRDDETTTLLSARRTMRSTRWR